MAHYSHDTVVRLIERIYDAAVAPANWPRFLDELAGVANGHSVNLSCVNVADPRLAFVATAKCDPACLEDYEAYYGRLDPWIEAFSRRRLLRPGLVDLGENFVPPAVLRKTEFYNDFGRRFDVVGGLTATFDMDGSLGALSFFQYEFGQFGSTELELVRTLLPHLRRALRVQGRLEHAERAAAMNVATLDRLPHGEVFQR